VIVNREQLKRDCAGALEALTRDQRLDGLAEIADVPLGQTTASMAS